MKRACVVAFAAWALLAPALSAAAPWEGRWRLVTQTYGAGEANLAPEDAPVRMDLVAAAAGPSGRIWAGDDARRAVAWPAFVAEGRALPVEVISLATGSAGTVEAAYRVRPVDADDLVLVIREAYVPSADGAWLEGTVEVRFEGGSTNRGGYTLHRRYARER